MQSGEDNYIFNLETPCNGSTKHKWEYKVPEMCVFGVEDKQMPEIPQLESSLGNYLQIVSPKWRVFSNVSTKFAALQKMLIISVLEKLSFYRNPEYIS